MRAINVVRERIVHRDMIKLRSRLVILCCPAFATIRGDAGTTVAHVRDPIGILWIDPKPMMISMPRGQQIKSFTAVDRTEEPGVHEIQRVRRFRISVNFAEIPGALAESPVVVHTRPMLAGIIGAIKATLFRFYDGINTVGIGAGNSDADLAEDSVGKAIAFKMFPSNAIIFGPV